MTMKLNSSVEFAFTAACADAPTERIKFWLKRLDDDQLRELVGACKRLVALAENELHVERVARE